MNKSISLDTKVEKLPRIGPAFQKKLKKMGIKTVQDLLFHFPHRYEDFSNIRPISRVVANDKNCVIGRVLDIQNLRSPRKKLPVTEAIIEDKSGAIRAVWFGQPYLTNVIKKGDLICLAGRAVRQNNSFYLSGPAFEKVVFKSDGQIDLTHTGRLVPVYPETEGLSSKWLRSIIKPLLKNLENKIPEIIPEEILKELKLPSRKESLWQIHFPTSLKEAQKALARFSFEELFLIELAVLRERARLNKEKAPSITINTPLIKKFVDSLPFQLTDSQKKCAWQILNDMTQTQPMSRLLQGDVGSGKTVVAVIASLNAVKAGYQVAFMAPTEILASQHFKVISNLLQGFNVSVALLTGKSDKINSKKLPGETIEISRKKVLERIREGTIDILVGTHTLIQDNVCFKKLGLCIIDEQHRFGVEQRAKLAKSGQQKLDFSVPHFLSMTATPIPRTLALTIYGDLDISLLEEVPKGRKKVITKIVSPNEREDVYEFLRKKLQQGEQAFVVCPRIEKTESRPEDNSENLKSVEQEYEILANKIFPEFKVAMLHGKMPSKEKEKIMNLFKNKKIDVLVATSVIEVGIDIPNASCMIIEGAERFGLAQLHQFRGRIGRSANLQAYCFLFTSSSNQRTRQRLRALLTSNSGFELAEKDLQIRGPGSLTGAKQWGIPDLAMESLRNLPLVEKAREAAKRIIESDPFLKNYPSLRQALKPFSSKIHLE